MAVEDFAPEVKQYARTAQELPFYTHHKDKKTPRFWQNVYRFNILFKYLKRPLLQGKQWIDFGAYPGHLQDLVEQKLGKAGTMAGLGHEKGFQTYFKNHDYWNVDFEKPVKENKDHKEKYQIATAFDIIEHLTAPNRMLDIMNYSLEKGGICIVVTDNVSFVWRSLSMLLKGGSPLDHLIKSSIFYTGAWRPHVRLYSKKELTFLMNHSGFEVVDHLYFDLRAAQYNNKNLKRKKLSLLDKATDLINGLMPHLKHHQLILGIKRFDFDELDNNRPKPTADEQQNFYNRTNWRKFPVFRLNKKNTKTY